MVVLEVKEMWKPRREEHEPLYGASGRRTVVCFQCLAKHAVVWPAPKAKDKVA
jgi:hypothetical protein